MEHANLTDIGIAKRGFVYTFTLLAIAGIFFVMEFVVKHLFFDDELSDVVAGIVGGFAFFRIRQIFEALTDRFFFRKDYDYGKTVLDLGSLLNDAADLPALAHSLDRFFMQTIKPERSVFLFKNGNAPALCREFAHDAHLAAHPPEDYESFFTARVCGLDQPWSAEEFRERRQDETATAAERLGIEVIIPLVTGGGICGAIFLGKKLSDAACNPKDMMLLAILSRQVGMAVENAGLYEAIKLRRDEFDERVSKQELQSIFFVDIAHELQTPVAILKANTDVISGRAAGDRKTAFRVVEMTLDRMSQMITGLLSAARLNFSKEPLRKTPIEVHAMLEDVYGDCSALIEEKGVLFSFASGPMVVAGDRDKLREVILNLVSNALKHVQLGGKIALHAERVNHEAKICVMDTGSGIPAENLPHIFERFYRIGPIDLPGAGIGLDICRQIIEAHGGSIGVESEVGTGTTFSITLPLHIPAEREEK